MLNKKQWFTSFTGKYHFWILSRFIWGNSIGPFLGSRIALLPFYQVSAVTPCLWLLPYQYHFINKLSTPTKLSNMTKLDFLLLLPLWITYRYMIVNYQGNTVIGLLKMLKDINHIPSTYHLLRSLDGGTGPSLDINWQRFGYISFTESLSVHLTRILFDSTLHQTLLCGLSGRLNMLRIGVRHIYHFAFSGQWFPNKQGTSFAQTGKSSLYLFSGLQRTS